MAAKPDSVNRRLAALGLAAALALPLAACTPEVPAAPTYTNDVKVILDAHCVRCHGAGDTLNTMFVYDANRKPSICYLQRYEDEGDCTTPTSTTCLHGAGYCGTLMGTTSLITTYINGSTSLTTLMPPPPSDALSAWERDVLTRWSSATPAP